MTPDFRRMTRRLLKKQSRGFSGGVRLAFHEGLQRLQGRAFPARVTAERPEGMTMDHALRLGVREALARHVLCFAPNGELIARSSPARGGNCTNGRDRRQQTPRPLAFTSRFDERHRLVLTISILSSRYGSTNSSARPGEASGRTNRRAVHDFRRQLPLR